MVPRCAGPELSGGAEAISGGAPAVCVSRYPPPLFMLDIVAGSARIPTRLTVAPGNYNSEAGRSLLGTMAALVF